MFRKHPQRVENFLEMCVLVPGAGGAAGARGAALASTESSAGSQPHSNRLGRTGIGVWGAGGQARGGSVTALGCIQGCPPVPVWGTELSAVQPWVPVSWWGGEDLLILMETETDG